MGLMERLPTEKKDRYCLNIRALCSISDLFSQSDKPYLDYRLAENIFCKSFDADNLTRSDIAIDARIGSVGIGIKTYVTGTTYQKIAEFDKESHRFHSGNDLDDVKTVCELRNKRLDFACNAFDVDELFYHCVVRDIGSVSIYECNMDYVDIDRIRIGKYNKSITFTDGINDYRFYRSKSTLLKDFQFDGPVITFNTQIMKDPLSAIVDLYMVEFGEQNIDPIIDHTSKPSNTLILPLFIIRNGVPMVPEKSGLNQGFAAGRIRDPDEIYISYPKSIRDNSEGFFPPRYVPFMLRLPDGSEMSASVCQDSGKSIMSNPNKALGHWLLRKVLNVPVGTLVTYSMLEDVGINAVMFTKFKDGTYSIDFTYIDDYSDIDRSNLG